MPGHFTQIHTAHPVADLLAGGEFQDWPALSAGGDARDARLRRGQR